jgi:hypothetical protein
MICIYAVNENGILIQTYKCCKITIHYNYNSYTLELQAMINFWAYRNVNLYEYMLRANGEAVHILALDTEWGSGFFTLTVKVLVLVTDKVKWLCGSEETVCLLFGLKPVSFPKALP